MIFKIVVPIDYTLGFLVYYSNMFMGKMWRRTVVYWGDTNR